MTAEHRKVGPTVPVTTEQAAEARALQLLGRTLRAQPSPPAPGWHRTTVDGTWAVDTYRSSWHGGVVWMATIPRGDGTFAVDVGRTRTRWGARRAGRAALRQLWLREVAR